jgi:hypothetical protein
VLGASNLSSRSATRRQPSVRMNLSVSRAGSPKSHVRPIGESETVGRRTALYVVMVAWGVVSVWSGARARRWLAQRQVPPQLAWPAAAATTVGLVVFAMAVLPPGPSPDAVPASVVWDFRLASLAGWAAYWSVLGTVFGWLTLPAGLRRLPSPEEVAAD